MRGFLQWIRALTSKLFHRFGIHCATHQIRLILISGLVITSLFYPALAIYTSSNPKPLQHFSSRIFDSFRDPDTRPVFEDDVRNVWAGHDALRVRVDSVARARCGLERTIRLERLLIPSTVTNDAGAINHHALLSTLNFEKELTNALSFNRSPCLTSSDQSCITLSPLEFWSHDERILMSDANLLSTINTQRNVSVAGFPLTPEMTLSGRESIEHSGSSIDFAFFLAITYLFNEDDCLGSAGHNSWLKTLDEVASQTADVTVKIQEPLLLALEYNPELTNSAGFSVITMSIYLSYIVFFIFFSGSMRRMDTVHSRVGLCFTGLVEILVSTITSLSVCAIGGLRITMVPWSILPIVIVFVGAENMFRLIDEVVKTPITLPVKERIGVGLSRAGTSNTLKVVSYNTILGVIAFFASGAIRQFCVFAIVVLVAHWFLIHTFFVAVLSIDIQRLELLELLRQDISLVPSPVASKPDPKGSAKPSTTHGVVMANIKGLLNGRVAKNVSLLLLLAITGTLYYATLPTSTRLREDIHVPLSRASIMRSKAESAKASVHSPAWRIWDVLNPDEDPLVHLRIETPMIVSLTPEHGGSRANQRSHRSRFSSRTLHPLLWLFKIMILPIGATIGALYIILLYLLKDAELLEAQRNRAGPGEDDIQSTPVEGKVSFMTLSRTSATDIKLLAANENGSVIASISLENEFRIWVAAHQVHIYVDTTDLLLRSTTSSATTSLTSVAVASNGQYCAVGTGTGVIGVYAIQKTSILSLPHLFTNEFSFAVSQLEFIPNPLLLECMSSSDHMMPSILATYDNRMVLQWTSSASCGVMHVHISPRCQRSVVNVVLLKPCGAADPLIAFCMDDGNLEVTDVRRTSSESELEYFFQAGSRDDLVTQVHACTINIDQTPHVVIVAATQVGIISLWDGVLHECISILDDSYGPVNCVRILPIPPKACSQCGEVPVGSFIVSLSVGHVVFVKRAFLSRRCSCPLNQPLVSKSNVLRDNTLGRRSRSNSFVPSAHGDMSPRQSRSRVSSFSNVDMPSFPISGHGGHSRRNSDKESSRRNLDKVDTLHIPFSSDGSEQDGASRPGFLDQLKSASQHSESPQTGLWRNLRLVGLGEATCERGGWDVIGSRILGLRRKSRVREPFRKGVGHPHPKHPSFDSHSLSSSVLDRWEVWIIDLSKCDGAFQRSPLSTLYSPVPDSDDNRQIIMPRLPFTRLSSVLMGDTFCIAGFGNTTGVLTFSN